MNAETAPRRGGFNDRPATDDQPKATAPVGEHGATALQSSSHRVAVAHLDALAAGVGSEYRFAVHAAGDSRWTTEFFGPESTRDAAALGVEWAANGAEVYVGSAFYTAAMAERLSRQRRRGGASDLAGIVGLGFDFDVDDEGFARGVLASVGLAPGLVVHSGGGFHLWLLLAEPLVFSGVATLDEWSTVARGVWDTVDARVRGMGVTDRFRGGKLDSTYDLPRLFRLAGTENHKQPTPRPVRLLDTTGPRVRVEDLAEIAGRRAARRPRARRSADVTIGSAIPVAETIARVKPMIELARAADRDVDRTWLGDRPDLADPSPSGLDLALASRLAASGWSDRDVADAIVARRAAAGDDLDKVTRRRDYLEQTVARARRPPRSQQGTMSAADVRDVVARAAREGVRR